MKHFKSFSVILIFIGISAALTAQDVSQSSDTTRKNAIKLFLDCRSCDMDYMRKEIPYINYVREVREAQLYLMVTTQMTGSGGREYTLFFTGQNEFAGMRDTLKYVTRPDDTQDIIRIGLTNTIAAGLMRYVVKTPIINDVKINYIGEPQEEPEQVADRWNFWVFEIETEPELNLEKSRHELNWQNDFSVDRITTKWKLENSFSHEYQLNVFFREDEDEITGEITETRTEAVRKSWEYDNLTVLSLNDHWSAGMRSEVSSSSFRNLDLQVTVVPAIEYNIFPYSQANQKQLRFLYGIGYIYNNYTDTTVYDMVSEHLVEQSLDLALEVQEKWGSANISLGASNYMHDFSKNRVELDGFVRIRILKGLSLSINGGIELIHNQIELAKGSRSDEDVYLRLRELETSYRVDGGIGLVYTFGSIFNNVVNPRF
ncbi:MAG: DUF481 domain-containing protein [Bacteroidales bacterium]|nr:DUF481 domain-containing protein [Bacteroidales bacterium]